MKTKAFSLTVLITTFVACNPIKQSEVPDNIAQAFKKSHPNAIISKWNDEPPIWEAKYTDGNEKGAVSFDINGVVTETELVIDENQLANPTSIQNYIKANYPDEKPKSFEKVTKADGTITYEIQITGKELVFDSKGVFLTEELD